MNVRQIAVGSFQANCFVVWEDENRAIVIDPGADADSVRTVLDQNDLAVAAYILTHGHMDHISALAELYGALPAPVGLAAADAIWAFDDSNQMPPFYPPPDRPAEIERDLVDGQEWTDGGMTYTILATPGHTPGGVCIYFPTQKTLFTGDTLFAGSIGRTDLPGGDSAMLGDSLAKLAALPQDTTVYCGHGPKTDIAHEKAHNPFLAPCS